MQRAGLMLGSQLPPPRKPQRDPEESSLAPAVPGTAGYFGRLFPEAEALEHVSGGRCWRLLTAVTIDGRATRQGYRCPAPTAAAPDADALAALTGDERWLELTPDQILYLDTETTGLSHGTGTYVFLAGLGRFTASGFIVEQFFMEDFGDEPALLAALEERLSVARALVTYNGRGFDLPLLTARWRMQRRRPPLPELHLDLLAPARRLWRGRLPDCSLGTVEREMLAVRRLSDVPGMLIPGIYFNCMRGADPRQLVPVVDHHVQDIVSLGALASLMGLALAQPDDPRFAHPSDQCGLWRILWARGRREEGLARLRAGLNAADGDDGASHRLAMLLAMTCKRMGRVEEALALWRARAGFARPDRLEALVELAKHAEHARRDLAEARRWTLRALDILDGDWPGPRPVGDAARLARDRRALDHRLARLERKLGLTPIQPA